jgi:hypothetical protein
MRSKPRAAVATPVVVHWQTLDPLKFSGSSSCGAKPYLLQRGLTRYTEPFEPFHESGDAQAEDSNMAQVNGHAREQSSLSPTELQRNNPGRVASITRTGM